jgi:hypothetical protein
MDAFSNIPDSQKGEFMRHLEDQQMKDSLRYENVVLYPLLRKYSPRCNFPNNLPHRMYNHLVESCFDKCVMTEWGGVSKSPGSIFIDRILMVVAYTGIFIKAAE